MPLVLTINPRKSTSFLKNLHFSSAVQNPVLLSRSSTSPTSLVYYCLVLVVNIRTLSIQAIVVMSSRGLRASFTTSWQEASILVSPIGMTVNSYKLKRVRNTIFYSSPFTIRIVQKVSRRSILEYQFALVSRFFISSILGRGYRFLIVIVFSRRKLITIRSLSGLPFFRTNIAGEAAGNIDFLIYPQARFLSIYLRCISSSRWDSE